MGKVVEFSEYVDEQGRSPFGEWFAKLDAVTAAKIRVYMSRVELGNYSCVAPIGHGLSEIKIDYGPGYRVYFKKQHDQLLLLLGGGTKKNQQKTIELAIASWLSYRARSKQFKRN